MVGAGLTNMRMSLYRKAALCFIYFWDILSFQFEPSIRSNIKLIPLEKNEIDWIYFQLYVFDHSYFYHLQYKHGVTYQFYRLSVILHNHVTFNN